MIDDWKRIGPFKQAMYGVFTRVATFERSLEWARNGNRGYNEDMALVVEAIAADWGLRMGCPPYAFAPNEVYDAALRRKLNVEEVVDLLNRHGMDGVTSLLGRS